MSQGNIELTLGLNTSPATQALQQYYARLNQGAKKAQKAQAPVGTALGKLTQQAKKLGLTYDKATNTFRNNKGAVQSISQVQARVKQLNASLAQTKAAAGKALGGIGAGFKQVLQGIPQGIGMAIGQALLAPIRNFQSVVVGSVKASIDGFVEIDRSLRQTLSIAGESSSRFDELSQAMNKLAGQTKFTAGELSEASVALARAGLSVDEIKEAMPGIAQGAAAAGEEISVMSNTVVAAMGGFQKAASETEEVVDILTAAANNSNTSVQELGEGLKYVGPVANSLGLEFADVAAAAGLLANAGIKSSQMGTSLRGGLTRLASAANGTNSEFSKLARGTGRMATVLQKLQIDLKDTEGNLKSMPELLKSLKGGFDQLGSTEKALAAKILFGDEAGTAWISLLNQNVSEIERFTEITNNASGVAAETSAKNLEGIAGSLELLRSAFDSAKNTLGQFFSVALKPIVDGLAAAFTAFNNLPAPIQQFAIVVGLATTAVAALTAATALWIAATKTAELAGLVSLIGNLKGGLAATAALMQSTVAGAFANLNLLMATQVGTMKAGLIPGFANLQRALIAAGTQSKAMAVALSALNLAAVGAAIGAVALAWDSYAKSVDGANQVNQVAKPIMDELAEGMRDLGKEVSIVNDEWERSVERVGPVQAGLDILRRTLGLTTAETVNLERTTIELGKTYGQIGDNVQDLLIQYKEKTSELERLTAGTEEYEEAQKELEAMEKLIDKATQRSVRALQKQREELLAGRDAVEELSEEEQRLLSVIDSLIKGFTAQGNALDALKPKFQEVAQEARQMDEAVSTKQLQAEAKEADAALEQTKQAFQGAMKAMETAFNNLKAAMKDQLQAEIRGIQSNLEELKASAQNSIKGIERAISNIQAQGAAANAAIDNQLKQNANALDSQIAGIQKRADAAIAQINSAAQRQNSAYNRQIARLNELSRKETQKAQKKAKDIQANMDRQTKAVNAEIEQVRKLESEKLKSLGKLRDETNRRFDEMESNASAAHQSIMRNYDQQLAAINRAKDATASQYDAALDRLREMTPAEQQLARIEEARLRRQAAMGGEEGLRAQAQLERAERDRQMDQLRQKRAQAIAQLEAQAAAVKEQAKQQELVYEKKIGDLQIARAKAIEEIVKKEAAVREESAARQEELQLKLIEIQEQGQARLEAAQDALQEKRESYAKRLADLEEKRTRAAERAAKRIAAVEKKAQEDIAQAKEEAALREQELQRQKEENDKRVAEQTKKMEEEIQKLKEGIAKAEKQAEMDIAKLKADHKKAEAQAEGEFARARNELMRKYNEAIGKSSNHIIAEGQRAWRTYANNAVTELARVKKAAIDAARATAAANAAAQQTGANGGQPNGGQPNAGGNRALGGPVDGGRNYVVNEYGQEAFLSKSGDLSLIKAPAWGSWRPKTDGTVLPASVTSKLAIPQGGLNISKGAQASMAAASKAQRAGVGGMANLVKAIKNAQAGDTITNNVTVQAENTTQAASDMLVSLTKIKNRRLR